MERYDLPAEKLATPEEAGVLRVAAETDEKNCGCEDAAITPKNLYKLSDYRIANTAYAIGDTVAVPYHANLFMECIVSGTTAGAALDTNSVYDGQQIVDGGVTWEVGVIGAIPGAYIEYTGDTPPAGTVDAGGGEVNRKTYARLFRIFGTKYGAGNGSTTFNLPNMNNGSFAEGSNTAGTVKSAGLPNITGTMSLWGASGARLNSWAGADSAVYGGEAVSENDVARASSKAGEAFVGVAIDASRSNAIYGNSTTVQPKAVTVKFCIKY